MISKKLKEIERFSVVKKKMNDLNLEEKPQFSDAPQSQGFLCSAVFSNEPSDQFEIRWSKFGPAN